MASQASQQRSQPLSALLNPIKDLAVNWDVDLVAMLEEYLITIDGITMNFSEAAMLIQGSTSVYSKKVEFLYMLVQEALHTLLSKKKLQQASSIDEQGRDKDAVSLVKHPGDEFLSLDDIPVAKNINLKDAGKKVTLMTRTPTFFVPLDDDEKGENLYSEKGEQIGNRNDYKLGMAFVHCNGMLLLDPGVGDGNFSVLPSGGVSEVVEPSLRSPRSPIDCVDNVPDFGSNGSIYGDGHRDEEEALEETNDKSKRDRVDIIERCVHNKNVLEPDDPYEDGPGKKKPFKKGKSCRVLAELAPQNNKTKRKRKLEPPVALSQVTSFCSMEYFSDKSKFTKQELRIPSHPELNKMYWQEQKERQKILLEKNKKSQESPDTPEPVNTFEPGPESDVEDNWTGADDIENFDTVPEPVPTEPIKELETARNPVNEERLIASSYEDLVRNRVEAFMTDAQKYGQVTELTRRVMEWEEKILPILEKEEEAEPFDIHEYGTRILDAFSPNNRKQTLPFRFVVRGQEKREIARYFLASLQLANGYSVGIGTSGRLGSAVNTMELTLLSRRRVHEDLDSYVAPSVQTSSSQ